MCPIPAGPVRLLAFRPVVGRSKRQPNLSVHRIADVHPFLFGRGIILKILVQEIGIPRLEKVGRNLAIVGILLVVAWPLPPGAGQTPSAVPPTFFGMTLTNQTHWPQDSVGALAKAPNVTWSYSEPQRGVFDWTNLDLWVQTAAAHKVDFFFSNALVPPWAAANLSTCAPTYQGSPVEGCTSTVANIQDWDNFVTALATRYKGRLIYELWNEPNAKTFTGTVAEMVTLTSHEYNIIRSIDPGAVIITPGCTYGVRGAADCLDQYFSAGGPTGVDVISWHGYWPDPEHVISEIGKLRTMMAKYGISSKPLWDTEGAWTGVLTAQQQAGFVARYYLAHASAGASRFYWYAWDSPTTGTMWEPIIGLRPDAIAYQQVYDWLVGATMSSPCNIATDSTWTCTLTRPGGYQAVAVWNSVGTASYTAAPIYKSYKDLAGNTHPVQGSVNVSYNPILLESQGRPAAPTDLSVISIK